MANKYIDVSATYNGDGTTSAQAASAGAPGAWNSLIAVMTGAPAYGTVDVGDKIYIRTKNGTNLGQTTSATVTMLARGAVGGDTIDWIFDDGTVWSGDSGTFTLTFGAAATAHLLIGAHYNNFLATNLNFVCDFLYTGSTGINWLTTFHSIFKNVKFKVADRGAATQRSLLGPVAGFNAKFIDCYFLVGCAATGGSAFIRPTTGSYTGLEFINCTVEITAAVTYPIDFVYFSAPCGVKATGLKFIGGKETDTVFQAASYTTPNGVYGWFDNIKCSPMKTVPDAWTAAPTGYIDSCFVKLSNLNAQFDFIDFLFIGYTQWKAGDNYPTLNAVLPDGATAWSIKVAPKYVAPTRAMRLFDLTKLYTLTAATKTITTEVLIPNTYSTPKANQWYMVVNYTDSDGNNRSENTFDFGNLATSTAGWSATTYGATTYSKFKLAITTDYAIKQNSDITVTVFMTRIPDSINDFYFVDPDFQLT